MREKARALIRDSTGSFWRNSHVRLRGVGFEV